MKTQELNNAPDQAQNVQAHRQSGGENAAASAETSELSEAASAAETPLCSVQRSCSPLSVLPSETESLEFGEFTWFDSADVEDDFHKILQSCRERASGRKLFVSVELSAVSQEDETMFSLQNLRECYKKELEDDSWSESRKKSLDEDQ